MDDYPTGYLIYQHSNNGDQVIGIEGGDIVSIGLDFALASPMFQANRDKNIIIAGPYKFRVIDWNWQNSYQILAVRDKHLAWFTLVSYKTKRILARINCNLILTAHIWGLTNNVEMGAMPTWGDVFIVKWFKHAVFKILFELQWHWANHFPGRMFPIPPLRKKLKAIFDWSRGL